MVTRGGYRFEFARAGERETRGKYRFMKLMKLKKGGGDYAVFYFAGKRKIFFLYL